MQEDESIYFQLEGSNLCKVVRTTPPFTLDLWIVGRNSKANNSYELSYDDRIGQVFDFSFNDARQTASTPEKAIVILKATLEMARVLGGPSFRTVRG